MSMDTEAIYRAIGMYAGALAMRDSEEAGYQMAEIKRLLKEAEDERAELLKENERLCDEVAECKAAYESQFKELNAEKWRVETLKDSLGTAVRLSAIQGAK